jgi:hypothetical protein
VRYPARQLRLLVSLEPVLELMSVPTCMLLARGERDAKAGKCYSRLERVLLCFNNAHDLASTLLPGYQVSACVRCPLSPATAFHLSPVVAKEDYGRYDFTVEESKHADYHGDVNKPSPGGTAIGSPPRETQLVQLKAMLDRILVRCKEMNSTESIKLTISTSRIGCIYQHLVLTNGDIEDCDAQHSLHLCTTFDRKKERKVCGKHSEPGDSRGRVRLCSKHRPENVTKE